MSGPMTRRQVRKRLSAIVTQNFERAKINNGGDNAHYTVSHTQMRALYHDIAFLGKVLMHLESKGGNVGIDTKVEV